MFESDRHPSFEDQPGPHAKVWRYMDLSRYLSLIQNKALHFARLDQMSDRWEAAYGPVNAAMRPIIYGEHWEQMAPQMSQLQQTTRMGVHVNCWHLSEVESAAMWDIYQRDGRGVAVCSTWSNVTSSIASDRSVHGGKIQYIDYSKTFVPEDNLFHSVMRKRLSFAHEQEVRFVTMTGRTAPNPENPDETMLIGPEDPVIPVTVDLAHLIDAVYVAPESPGWFRGVIENVTEKYDLDVPVHQSDLASDPVA